MLFMRALHVLSVALNIYVLEVISCGTSHRVQRVVIINTVHQVHKNLTDVCITGKASVDNTEWVSSTCHSNLSDEKLPVCFKANKMNFPVKPECLNFTPLEKRLRSLQCIPFIQLILFELLRGGQLFILGNVVNVPADVNSVVSTLPKPVNGSQTIPIKLKSKLS